MGATGLYSDRFYQHYCCFFPSLLQSITQRCHYQRLFFPVGLIITHNNTIRGSLRDHSSCWFCSEQILVFSYGNDRDQTYKCSFFWIFVMVLSVNPHTCSFPSNINACKKLLVWISNFISIFTPLTVSWVKMAVLF